MGKPGLVVFGTLILIATLVVTQFWLTPAQKSDIKTIDSLCTTEVEFKGINLALGSWGQKALGKEEECKQAHSLMIIIEYGWIGFLIGGLLFFIGLVSGGAPERRTKEPEEHKVSFCGECGAKLFGHEKHCSGCGTKLK